ncbi:hypothetical protein AALP_AAs40007U000200 [Arabis alpina]|uniref:Uncharacterized protein n=1 Tax=Arabis alpina TaxID=50452 RepID=A0A087FZ03_ARAAL|nr:hypothetical protein AALP_AAs40007U000200 [Arabis alpina]
MVVTSRGGRGGSQGRGHGGRETTSGGGVNRVGNRGKQTVISDGPVKPTVGPTSGVSEPGGPSGVGKHLGDDSKQTKFTTGGVKRTSGDASTSHAPPPLNSREATSSHHLPNINLNVQPWQQASQSRQIEQKFENEDEEDENDEGDGEQYQAEELDDYHEPEGLDDEQLLENVLALPGRQRLPLLSEVPMRDTFWFTRNNGILTLCIEVMEHQPCDGVEDPDLASELSTQRNLTVGEKNQIFLKCNGMSQKFNKGKRNEPCATSSSAAVDLEELQEEKSVRPKIVEHDEEIRRCDEENKKRDEENKKRDEENRRRDAELLELRQSHSQISEMEKLSRF